MEVEPDIVNIGISYRLVNLSHFIANALLTTLLVDQINPVLLRVIFLCLLDVPLCRLKTLIKVLIDSHGRCPSHRRLHLPYQWDTSPDLQVARNRKAAICLLLRNYVLCLAEICSMAIFIQSANHKSPAHTARILPRNQYKARACINRLNRDKAIDARHAERSVLYLNELFEHLVIEGELMHVVDAVWEEAEQAVRLVAWILV